METTDWKDVGRLAGIMLRPFLKAYVTTQLASARIHGGEHLRMVGSLQDARARIVEESLQDADRIIKGL